MLTPASLARLPALQQLLIWGLGASVAAVIGYGVFYVPTRAERVSAENRLGAARSALASAQQELAAQEEWAAALARDESALGEALARTPGAEGRAPELLFVLPEVARSSGLQVERWQPQPEQPAGEHCALRPVLVQARGPWPALAEFLRRVAALPEVVAIDELSIGRSPDASGDDGALEISFRASALRVRGPYARSAALDRDPSARL